MNNRIFLALDPGDTTGWASFDECTGTFMSGHIADTSPHIPGHHMELFNFIHDNNPDVIIYEHFENRAVAGASLKPVEYIGVIRYWWRLHCIRTIKSQGAANIKKFVPNRWIKDIGVWDVKHYPHGMDAMRHLLYYLVYTERKHDLLPSYMAAPS